MTHAQLADALGEPETALFVAKILLHDNVRDHLNTDRELVWAVATLDLRLQYLSKVERVIDELRASEPKSPRKRVARA